MKKEMPEASVTTLINLLQSGERYANQNSYQQALGIYAQVIDIYLTTHEPVFIAFFERITDSFLPQLDRMLIEASSLIISEPSQPMDLAEIPDKLASHANPVSIPLTLLPLLTTEIRHSWLKRLFALWLKYRDKYRVCEQLQQIMIEVAWSEDIACLRNLVESELRHATLESRIMASQSHALEKFLQELS